MKEQQKTLVFNVKTMTAQSKQAGVAKRYLYGAVAVLVFAVVASAVAMVVPMDNGKPLLVHSAILMATVLAVIIIHFVGSRQLEGFAVTSDAAALYSDPSSQSSTAQASSSAEVLDAVQNAVLREVYVYLTNSVYLSLMLKSDQAYGNVNFAMEKELDRYTVQRDGKQNTINMANQRGHLIQLNETTTVAQTSFLLTLALVLTIGVLLYSATHSHIVTAVALVLVVAATFIYMMETLSRVRTDGRKMYWGAPYSGRA